ncbi:winged helix-turn-helix domain-containing protein [Streptomyces sp. NPDC051940]|uniref:ArsR/SmtB family transcription factor n=1 Tax=Streptomyces sp. NPDC051940 TaxID=3155675 RepID=UPI003435841F
MGLWLLDTDTLAGSRFSVSELAEVTAVFLMLQERRAKHPGEHETLTAHAPAYRELLAADPVLDTLADAVVGHRAWLADFLTPATAYEPGHTFEEELAVVRATAPHQARADLVVSRPGPLPPVLDRDDVPELLGGLLTWVWTRIVRPEWPRRRRALEADIVARTRHLTQGGWSAALDDMRPGMRWLGEGRLQINMHDYPPKDISGKRLLFIPVTPSRGWVAWDLSDLYVLTYPCHGVLAGADRERQPPLALGRLLGPHRAAALMLLGTPMSTTQLVALTGQGLGSVGRHLKVLYDARLIARRRSGRSVLYYRTEAGDVLVRAQTGPVR